MKPINSPKTYTDTQKRKAFKLVADKTNWKNPIDTIVPKNSDTDLISEAVTFFTGSVPDFVTTKKGIRVTADGYYLSIGS